MNRFPSRHNIDSEDSAESTDGREKLFHFIERCNGNGVTINEFLEKANDPDDSIKFIHLDDLQKAKRIKTQVVRGEVVWVINGERSS